MRLQRFQSVLQRIDGFRFENRHAGRQRHWGSPASPGFIQKRIVQRTWRRRVVAYVKHFRFWLAADLDRMQILPRTERHRSAENDQDRQWAARLRLWPAFADAPAHLSQKELGILAAILQCVNVDDI